MNEQNTNTRLNDFSSEIELTPLLQNYKKLLILQSSLLFLIILIPGIALYILESEETPTIVFIIGAILWVLLFSLRLLVILKGFSRKAYSLQEKDIHFQTGYINRKFISIPINRIQHIEIKEGLLSRILGLAQIKLYTAGNGSHDLSLKGISLHTATEIKNTLSKTIKPYDNN